jgi:site-specific recombinase XerD
VRSRRPVVARGGAAGARRHLDEAQTREFSAPTAKQRLAALRHLFGWLVAGQVVPHNPATLVCGPRHGVKRGNTPALDAAEARQLLDNIDTTTPAGPTALRRCCSASASRR